MAMSATDIGAYAFAPVNREQRLRARLDFISDQRDKALEDLWDAKTRIEHLEELNQRLRHDKKDLLRSRDMWKQRAREAEAMVRRK